MAPYTQYSTEEHGLHVPGSAILDLMVSVVLISCSSGALIIITVEPTRERREPTFPCKLSRSPRRMEERKALWRKHRGHTHFQVRKETKQDAHLTMTLIAPKGVTRTAGAKAYAEKFATSPAITENRRPRELDEFLILVMVS